MAIVNKATCDICHGFLNPDLEDCIAVVGNINVVTNKNEDGVGGGLFGDGKWLENFTRTNPVPYDNPLDAIPVHHLHVKCIGEYIKTQVRGKGA